MKKIILLTFFALLSSLCFNLAAEEDATVKVYGHTGCPWTVKTLKYLDKQNINYNLLDVKNDVAANRVMIVATKKFHKLLLATRMK